MAGRFGDFVWQGFCFVISGLDVLAISMAGLVGYFGGWAFRLFMWLDCLAISVAVFFGYVWWLDLFLLFLWLDFLAMSAAGLFGYFCGCFF